MGVPCHCPRTGGLGQGQHLFLRRFLRSKKRNSVAAESEGGQKFLPPNPLPFCPPERFSFAREAHNHSEFCSKNVRTSSKKHRFFTKKEIADWPLQAFSTLTAGTKKASPP